MLWITEENSVTDNVLQPGDVVELTRPGKAIVLAHRAARVVLEVPQGVSLRCRVEAASGEGEHGTRIGLDGHPRVTMPEMASVIVGVFASALGRFAK